MFFDVQRFLDFQTNCFWSSKFFWGRPKTKWTSRNKIWADSPWPLKNKKTGQGPFSASDVRFFETNLRQRKFKRKKSHQLTQQSTLKALAASVGQSGGVGSWVRWAASPPAKNPVTFRYRSHVGWSDPLGSTFPSFFPTLMCRCTAKRNWADREISRGVQHKNQLAPAGTSRW